ncbi:MAG: ABC transporter substrate-binding protein [Acidobacteria bacterium]|nr:ABC transporter substrate-binding protein [Acidobacteriota bacterium]
MIHDALGRAFSFPSPPRCVVSLVPSLTETLFDLGAGDSVVAITDFCIFPENLPQPRVGGTKNPRIEAIRALGPDLVHMNLEENQRRHAEELETFTRVFTTEPKTLKDVEQLFVTLGAIHHRDPAPLVEKLRAARAALPPRSFTFAVPIWKRPWMWCGGDTYVSRLVEATGGTNVLASHARYPQVDPDDVRADVIFLPDEPYAFTKEDRATFPDARVIGPFRGHLFTWHGSRTILGLQWLGDALKT